MNKLVAISEPSGDLVSVAGVFNDQHFLFRCELVVLAGNIRTLLREYERGRAALCQNIAVAYLRIKRGESGITWETWCKRFVLKSSGEPYSPATIETWLKIGMKPDVEAAWTRHCEEKKSAERGRHIARLQPIEQKAIAYERLTEVAGKQMIATLNNIKPRSLFEDETASVDRQFQVLRAAWDIASEAARERFLAYIMPLLPPAEAAHRADGQRG